MISFAFTTKLICAFVFAYANCWFSRAKAHILIGFINDRNLAVEVSAVKTEHFIVIKSNMFLIFA